MEIARVDPYLVRWSADGTIALATESTGIQFLVIDCKALLDSKLKWTRTRSPTSISGRVLDMQWSPTLLSSGGGCQLACVMDSGKAYVFELVNDDVKVIHSFSGSYSALCWAHRLLVLGDSFGSLQAYQGTLKIWHTKADTNTHRITSLIHSSGIIGVLTSDQKCWLVKNNKDWETIVEKDSSRINSIAFADGYLVVQYCGKARVIPLQPARQNSSSPASASSSSPQSFQLISYLPGNIMARNGEIAIVHTDGKISGSNSLGIPRIEGEVVGTVMHPTLPMAAVVVGGSVVASQDWRFPILSRQSVNLSVFPLPGELKLPRRSLAAASASWLALMMKGDMMASLKEPEPFILKKMSSDENEQSEMDLASVFHNLFCSEWFDYQRFLWYKHSDDRPRIESVMQNAIVSMLQKVTPVTPVDKLVVALYLNLPFDAFKIRGDFITEEFPESQNCEVSFSSIKSVNGREWKRCALTKLPLVNLDTKISADGVFTCYRNVPKLINGAEVETNPITDALLDAAKFCIFNGACWQMDEEI